MEVPVNLECMDKNQFRQFIDSFDTVISDCDGVLYTLYKPIPGALEAISKLKEINKSVHYMSNNSILQLDMFNKKLNAIGFNATEDDILYPTLSIIRYLKKIHFNKKAYILGFKSVKEDFRQAGIDIVDIQSNVFEENLSELGKLLSHDSDIGAVILDLDININYEKILKAALHIQKPDVLFIVGATDHKLPIGTHMLLGPGYFLHMLQEFTGREALVFGKPSPVLCEFVKEKFAIKDPKRVLFIGDSLYQDISFANLCGFQKLFVLTGINTLEDALNADESKTPDYYINSLGDLFKLINKHCPANQTL